MNDASLISEKIQEELEKAIPSKKKIASYLLDLLKKDKFPSLSDFEFYDIVGFTYALNLKFKLNLEMLFYPVYAELKKKFKKLYGDDKKLEMERYLLEKFGLYSPEHIFNTIKSHLQPFFELENPSMGKALNIRTEILTFLYGLLNKEEYKHLSDTDFTYIVEETFKLNPDFFMTSLYDGLRQRVKKQKRLKMDKFVIEKYCLLEDESIIFECNGNLTFFDGQTVKESGGLKITGSPPASVVISSGSIFLTDYRILAQGTLDTKGGRNPYWGLAVWTFSGDSRRREAQRTIIEAAPSYGYQFPWRNHLNLTKTSNGVSYSCIQDNQYKGVKIKIATTTSQANRIEERDTLFDILRKDINQIIETIQIILEMNLKIKWKRHEIIILLLKLRASEEYQHLTDSERLNIIGETYEMNPQFFMEHVYPKLISAHEPSFESIKKDLIELIEKLNKEQIYFK